MITAHAKPKTNGKQNEIVELTYYRKKREKQKAKKRIRAACRRCDLQLKETLNFYFSLDSRASVMPLTTLLIRIHAEKIHLLRTAAAENKKMNVGSQCRIENLSKRSVQVKKEIKKLLRNHPAAQK